MSKDSHSVAPCFSFLCKMLSHRKVCQCVAYFTEMVFNPNNEESEYHWIKWINLYELEGICLTGEIA